MSKEIELTQGYKAIVDDADYECLNKMKWCVSECKGGYLSAMTNAPSGVKPRTIKMHRLITKAMVGQDVDHINGNSLDNRSCNLRLCNRSQNLCNHHKRRAGVSGYTGVSPHGNSGRWRAYVNKNGRQLHCGYFDTAIEAAKERDRVAKIIHGEFFKPSL